MLPTCSFWELAHFILVCRSIVAFLSSDVVRANEFQLLWDKCHKLSMSIVDAAIAKFSCFPLPILGDKVYYIVSGLCSLVC